ncbi:MAG: hypothetical protein ACREC6_09515 [Hyphomicrobiaceae bacterium]
MGQVSLRNPDSRIVGNLKAELEGRPLDGERRSLPAADAPPTAKDKAAVSRRLLPAMAAPLDFDVDAARRWGRSDEFDDIDGLSASIRGS